MLSDGNIKKGNNFDTSKNSPEYEILKQLITRAILEIEDNTDILSDKTNSLKRRLPDLLNLGLDAIEHEEERKNIINKIDTYTDIITDTDTDGVNGVFYLGVLYGLTAALNEQKLNNNYEDTASYLIKRIGTYFYQLENIPELKRFYQD